MSEDGSLNYGDIGEEDSEELLGQQSDGDFEYDYEDAFADSGSDVGVGERKEHTLDDYHYTGSGGDDAGEMLGSTIVRPVCLPRAAMVEGLVAEVQDLAQTLQVSFASASRILRSRHWDRVRVFEEFTSEGGAALLEGAKQQHEIAYKTMQGEGEGAVMCSICCDEYEPKEMLSAGCEHYYCKACWGYYLTGLVEVGQVFNLVCMETTCASPCCDELIQLTVDDETFTKYKNFMGKFFIDEHPYIFWCPNAGCDRAVRVPNLAETNVQCHCEFQFCIKCSKEAHAPCSCETMDRWTAKSGEDGATANWIIANTKVCPKCQKPIEKNGGCNHMTCSQCRHEFCWLCMGNWNNHRACNSFKPSERESEARATLERYLFYWQRYNTHLQSQKLEHKILEDAVVQMEHKRHDAGTHEAGYYLLEAAGVLIACRRALKYTYVHAYFMENPQEKSLFEFLQQQLEYNTEVLSRLLSTPEAEKSTVVNQTAAAKRRLDNLLEGAKEGLLAMNDSEEWSKWQEALGVDGGERLDSAFVPPAPKEMAVSDVVTAATAEAARHADDQAALALALERSLLDL